MLLPQASCTSSSLSSRLVLLLVLRFPGPRFGVAFSFFERTALDCRACESLLCLFPTLLLLLLLFSLRTCDDWADASDLLRFGTCGCCCESERFFWIVALFEPTSVSTELVDDVSDDVSELRSSSRLRICKARARCLSTRRGRHLSQRYSSGMFERSMPIQSTCCHTLRSRNQFSISVLFVKCNLTFQISYYLTQIDTYRLRMYKHFLICIQ